MPLQPGSTIPEEKKFDPIPADVYVATITDIEEETKPSIFTNPDGSPQEPQTQYRVKFTIADVGPYFDRWLLCWIKPTLRASTKSKRPTLAQFLLAVTGKTFGPEDRDAVTADLINSTIGAQLRITTQIEASKTTGTSYACVTSFLALKK